MSAYWKANQRRLAPWLFLAPGMAMFLIYVIGPIIESIWISFYDWDGLSKKTWIGASTLVEPIVNVFINETFTASFAVFFQTLTTGIIFLVAALLLVPASRRSAVATVFTALFAVIFLLQVLVPSISAVWGEPAAKVAGSTATWVGFGNYVELFQDENFLKSLWNNLIWLIMFMLAVPIGLFMAIFLNQTVRGIRIYKSLFFFPFVISQVVVGLMFAWFYAPNFGLFYKLIELVTGTGVAVLADENYVNYGIIAAGLWPQIAYVMILYLTGLNNVAPDQIEAARLDGAKGWKMLWYVVIPQLRPATFIAVVVTVIGALRSFDLVSIMTSGGPYGSSRVLSYYMYEQALSEYGYRMGYGAAIAVVLFGIMMIFISGFIWKMWRDETER